MEYFRSYWRVIEKGKGIFRRGWGGNEQLYLFFNTSTCGLRVSHLTGNPLRSKLYTYSVTSGRPSRKWRKNLHLNIYLSKVKWRKNLGSLLSGSLCKVFEELMRIHWGVTNWGEDEEAWGVIEEGLRRQWAALLFLSTSACGLRVSHVGGPHIWLAMLDDVPLDLNYIHIVSHSVDYLENGGKIYTSTSTFPR